MKLAFLFLLVGYGTKTGLAPLHSWLPDAHSQAPAPVSALFSGFLLNTALYCILRYLPLVEAATGDAGWGRRAARGVRARSRSWWRRSSSSSSTTASACWPTPASSTWASSPWALGLGGVGAFAALCHALNHSLVQGAGLLLGRAARARCTARTTCGAMSGACARSPVWGVGFCRRGSSRSSASPPFAHLPERVPDPPGGRGRPGVRGAGPLPARRRHRVRRGAAARDDGRLGRRDLQARAADRQRGRPPCWSSGRWRSSWCSACGCRARSGSALEAAARSWSGAAHEPGASSCASTTARRVPAARCRCSPSAEFRAHALAAVAAGARLAALFGLPRADERDPAPAGAGARRRPGRCRVALDRRAGRLPGADARLPAGPLVRAGDRRAVGRPPGGPSLAQADPLPPLVPARPGRLGSRGRGRDPARRDRLLPGRGRGGPRGGRRAGARRRHRAGPLPLPVPRRARASTWRSRWATSTAASSAPWSGGPTPRTHPLHGDAGRRHDDRPRHGLLPGGGGAGRLPRPGAGRGAARHRPGAGAAGQPHRRPGRAGRRRRLPADRVLLRPAPRRLPEPDRAALRQPLRPRPGAARRRGVRPRRGRAPPSCGDRLDRTLARRGRAPSTCCGTRRRCWPASRRPAPCRREVARGARPGRAWPPGPAGSSATCATTSRPASTASRRSRSPRGRRGDVFARAYVRWLEIQRSAAFVRDQLRAPAGRPDPRRGGPAARRISWSSRWSRAGAARSATSP